MGRGILAHIQYYFVRQVAQLLIVVVCAWSSFPLSVLKRPALVLVFQKSRLRGSFILWLNLPCF